MKVRKPELSIHRQSFDKVSQSWKKYNNICWYFTGALCLMAKQIELGIDKLQFEVILNYFLHIVLPPKRSRTSPSLSTCEFLLTPTIFSLALAITLVVIHAIHRLALLTDERCTFTLLPREMAAHTDSHDT